MQQYWWQCFILSLDLKNYTYMGWYAHAIVHRGYAMVHVLMSEDNLR